ncbi:MAG: TylF/MycF/NovP-related O-methyltransferase [Flavobacteriaceae bacterium]
MIFTKIIRKINYFIQDQKDKKRLMKLSSEERKLISEIKSKNLTYLTLSKLAAIVHTLNSIEQKGYRGLFIEAGCALGGSSILISKLKNTHSKFKIYDVFEMIPPPSDNDTQDVHDRFKEIKEGKSKGIGGELYYGYQDHLLETVKKNLADFDIHMDRENIDLIKGLVQNTLHINEPVVFAHIDVDWYDPVTSCLEQIWPNLIPGGSILLDDYNDWGGCKKATDQYFKGLEDQFLMDDRFGSLKVTRIK